MKLATELFVKRAYNFLKKRFKIGILFVKNNFYENNLFLALLVLPLVNLKSQLKNIL